MAEIVNEMQERLLPEYEQLRKFEVCTEEQIRDCMRKRESLQLKITQSQKSIRDYADFIIFEKKVHKWIDEKEKLQGTKIVALKTSIAKRIIRLYREGLRHFPHEERFWDNYIRFSKKSVPHEVLGIYEKMLAYHGEKPHVWCDAALWTYEYSLNIAKVKEIFYRGLQIHRSSELLNKTFFDILLIEASKMNNENTLDNNTKSEQSMGLEFVKVAYRNSRNEISNITYYLKLLDRCEEHKFAQITGPLQKLILDDLMDRFPTNELLWDTLAQRELRGFNMNDLKTVENKETNVEQGNSEKEIQLSNATEETDVNSEDVKDPNLIGIWQKRTLKRRITLCVSVYQTAVQTLKTTKIWTLYINAMLKLNQDMSTQSNLKRKCLANAFKDGHESGLMSTEHYCTYIQMLMELPEGIKHAEHILEEANKTVKALELFEHWLSLYIMENDEQKVYEIFRKAHNEFGVKAVPLWMRTIQFYKTRYDDCSKRLLQIYREACQQSAPEFGILRGEFMEFCILNMSLEKTRSEYDKLCQLPPPSLDLHMKMAEIESRLAIRNEKDLERWRLCYENATYYFGKTNINIWLDYIKFERDNGDPKKLTLLYQRAKDILLPNLADDFITQHSLMLTNT